MAKKGRHRRGGRVTPKGTRPQSFSAGPSDPGFGFDFATRDEEPDLARSMRRALRSRDPVDLLTLVSSLLAAVDPRRKNPFDRSKSKDDGDDDELTRDGLLQSFLAIEQPETSAVLAVIAATTADELERTRIRRELDIRQHELPRWLAGLSSIECYRAVEMVHVLNDGDDVMVGCRLPTGEEFSVVSYIDHNLGTVAKDGFIVPRPMAELVAIMQSSNPDPDTSWNDISLAEARARIEPAVESGAMTIPPYESETWPECRPLVEWIMSRLPAGGTGYQRHDWTEDERNDIADRFLDSPFAEGLRARDYRDLLENLLWFGCDYGPGDPLQWSPVRVELLLADWLPRKIVADVEYLTKAPALLRGFIRFAHHERGIRPALTDETLAAVDEWEPDYQETIRSPRLQGPAALLAAAGAIDPDEWLEDGADYNTADYMFEQIERAVGVDNVSRLTDEPLPDEPFAWEGIPDDTRERVGEVLALCDRTCDELLDVQSRTACRRFLARAAVGDPAVFRRRARNDKTAATIIWIIAQANELFDSHFLVKDLLAHFGIAGTTVSDRAETLLRAAGVSPQSHYGIHLGSPDYLVSARRRRLIELRDKWVPATE